MANLRFGVLGPLEVVRDGAPVPVPSGRRRAVLACLLVNAGRPVSADALIEAGWGEELPERPRAALNTVLSRLRTLLGDGVLRPDPAGHVLDVPADAVDAARFEAVCEQATTAPAEQAVGLLRDALALWRGPAYAEFTERDFVGLEAQRLDLLRLRTMESRAALSIDAGHVDDAVTELGSVLAGEPFREQAVQLLMTALYRDGRATEALDTYQRYRTMLVDELGLDPSPALEELQSRILGHELPSGRGSPGVPEPPAWLDSSTPFVGREETLAQLADAVSRNRLVSIIGPGGVGKTRLAAEALSGLSERLAAPISVVELAGVRSGAIDAAVAEAIGLSRRAAEVREACLEYLSISECLLVLDNCEHLLGETASLVDAIGRRCPRVRVLLTSRHRLNLPTERVLPLEPLPTPAGDARWEQTRCPAVLLFADRVRRVRPTSDIVAESPGAVAQLCRLLDGLPLALELAASRAAVLGVAPVLDDLRRSLSRAGDGEAGAGYAELRAVVDWSYALLSPEERRLFAALSVFAADFDAAAVLALAQGWAGSAEAGTGVGHLLDPLAELADASLLSTREADGEVRYRMLTLIRSHAAGQLADIGEEVNVRHAHAQWVRDLVGRGAADHLGPRSPAAFAPLDRSRADIADALRWTTRTGDLALAGEIAGTVGLCRQWPADPDIIDLVIEIAERTAASEEPRALPLAAGACVLADRSELSRSRQLGRRALELAQTPPERFLARLALGVGSIYSGEHRESQRWWAEISAMTELPPAYRAEGHLSLALLCVFHDDLAAAHRHSDTALATVEVAGSPAMQAFARYVQGEVAVKEDLDRGESVLAGAAAEADLAGAEHVSRVARLARLAALVRLDRTNEALDLVGPLVEDERRAGAWPQLWTTLRILAELLASEGHHRDAAFLLASARSSESAPPVVGDDVSRYQTLTEGLRGHLGTGVADGISQLAAGVPRTQVIDRARAVLGKLRG